MAVFDRNNLKAEWKIWQLCRYGPITLFRQASVLEETVRHLKEQKYLVHEFDCGKYEDDGKILADITTELGVIQDYDLTPNLAGFEDYLSDTVVPVESGLVLVLRNFDVFHSRFPYSAKSLLEIISHRYHQDLLFGLRFFALIQINDPQMNFDPIHSFQIFWNDKESRLSDRGQPEKGMVLRKE